MGAARLTSCPFTIVSDFVFQILPALSCSAAISVERLQPNCQTHFNHAAAPVTLRGDEEKLTTLEDNTSSLPLMWFLALAFVPYRLSHTRSITPPLPLSHPSPPSNVPFFKNKTHPSGGVGWAGWQALVVRHLREGDAHLMTPHEQWRLKPNACRRCSLPRFPFLTQLSSLFSLPPSDTLSVAISASALHLFAQLLCSFRFLLTHEHRQLLCFSIFFSLNNSQMFGFSVGQTFSAIFVSYRFCLQIFCNCEM